MNPQAIALTIGAVLPVWRVVLRVVLERRNIAPLTLGAAFTRAASRKLEAVTR